jgi:PilZ domain
MRFQGGNVTADCLVRNISTSGARVDVDRTIVIPHEFELDIPQRGDLLRCRLAWRTDDRAGVKFVDSPEQRPIDTLEGALAKIAQLEKENGTLRLEIGRLAALLASD